MHFEDDQPDGQHGVASAVDKAFDAIHAALTDGQYTQAIIKREALYIPGAVSGMERGFPSIADIEQALEQDAFLPNDLRVYSGRKPLDLHDMRFVNRERIEPQMLANAALSGATMGFNHLQQRILKAHWLARRLEQWLGDAIELVLIASFGRESGFSPHHDELPVVIVQLDGVKHWTLFGDPVAPGAPVKMEQEPGPQRQLTLNSGDVLVLPAGQRHFCDPQGYSVHLAIVIASVTAKGVRKRLEKALKESVVLQEPVPAILGEENDRMMAKVFRSHLHALVDQLDIEEIFAQERKHLKIRPKVQLAPRKS